MEIQHDFLALLTKAIHEKYPEATLSMPPVASSGVKTRGIAKYIHAFEPPEKALSVFVDTVMQFTEKCIQEDFQGSVTHIVPRAYCEPYLDMYEIRAVVTLDNVSQT